MNEPALTRSFCLTSHFLDVSSPLDKYYKYEQVMLHVNIELQGSNVHFVVWYVCSGTGKGIHTGVRISASQVLVIRGTHRQLTVYYDGRDLFLVVQSI